jgi:hypothetical protein
MLELSSNNFVGENSVNKSGNSLDCRHVRERQEHFLVDIYGNQVLE